MATIGCGHDTIQHFSLNDMGGSTPDATRDNFIIGASDTVASSDAKSIIINCPLGDPIKVSDHPNCVALLTKLADECCPQNADTVKNEIQETICASDRINDKCKVAIYPPTFALTCNSLKVVPGCL